MEQDAASRPSCRGHGRKVRRCRETITVTADDNGAWSFRWSWGDRIALVDEVAAAAFKIAYVLTPQAG